MADYYFERECRTPYSEAYNILDDDATIARLDLHYTQSIVHATLSVVESLTKEAIEELVETIDDELLDVVGVVREEFVVHVYQGREVGVYSNHDFGENGGEGV